MRNRINNLIKIALLILVTPVYAGDMYIIDPNHSTVSWKVNHLGFSNQTGKWFVNGDIDFDPQDITQSKVKVTIRLSEMVIGIKDLEKHLKGKLFFDTVNYPQATFASSRIEKISDSNLTVTGNLTLHGVTQPIKLDVILNKKGPHPIQNKETLGFSGTAKLKRSDFGIDTLIPEVSDEVDLRLELEAVRK